MRRIVSLIVLLVLCLVLPAQAETQYPLSQGIVTDLADVLREDTVTDLTTLSERAHNASLGQFYVVTRHFLGGTDASVYARQLFEAWHLNSDDVLFLMVIGEEKYAMEVGSAARSALSADTQTSLMASHFRAAFLNREYDRAVNELSVQTVQTMAKAAGKTLNTNGLFGTAAVQPTTKPQSASSVWEGMFSFQDYQDEDWPLDIEYSSHTSFNWRGWLVWGLVIYFVFFRKKKSKNAYDFGHGPKNRRR